MRLQTVDSLCVRSAQSFAQASTSQQTDCISEVIGREVFIDYSTLWDSSEV